MKKEKIKATPPPFQSDPRFQQGIESLQTLGGRLSSFDFTGDLAPLQETIDLDPEITRLALEQAEAELGPAFEDTINQVKQEAIAANQAESSTFTDALAREGGRLNSLFQGITAGAALEDRSRALENRVRLQQIGGGLTTQGTAFAGQNQALQNEIAQRNFESQLGIDIANRSNRGGILGGLTGAAGGFLAAGLPGAVAGGVLGGIGPSGTGGQILSAGGSIAATRARPRSSAGNTSDLFGGVGGNTGSRLERQLRLFDPTTLLNFN